MLSILDADEIVPYAVSSLHVGLYLLLLGTTLFRHLLSFRVRTVLLFEVVLVIVLSRVIDIKSLGFETICLFLGVISAIVLFGTKDGFYTITISLVVIITITLLFISGLYSTNFDLALYAQNPTSWILAITMLGVLLSLTISGLTLLKTI